MGGPTRRRVGRRGFLLLTTTAAAACAAPRGVAAPAGGPGAPGFPRVVRDAAGRAVDVPAPPRRVVVATEYAALDSLLMLGAVPVAAVRRFEPDWPWTAAAGGTAVERLPDEPDGPAVETIASRRPDLVLALKGTAPGVVEQLSRLTPTVVYDGDDGRACLRVVADALGLPERAEALIAGFDVDVASARDRVAAAGRATATFATFMVFPDGSAGWFGRRKDASLLLGDLGLRPNALVAGTDGWGQLSAELLPQLDADVLIGRQEDAGMEAVFGRFEADPLFRAVPAVAAGRYTRLSLTESWALGTSSLLGWTVAVGRLADIVVASAR